MADDIEWRSWTVEDLNEALIKNHLNNQAELFKEKEIDGNDLISITNVEVRNILKHSQNGDAYKVITFLNQLGCKLISLDSLDFKVFNDPIHGHIEIHPLCVKIIDTRQFQRLRKLKQLGAVDYVYPGASHNRFNHSIGVCHLAGEVVTRLQRQQPELKITNVDVLCVKIAALCHDLGHGPFSHLYDGQFIPSVAPEKKWKHEHGSVLMLRRLIEDNGLEGELEEYGILKKDIKFIEEQIEGEPEKGYKGREDKEDKKYLYEIVSNARNGIDVDKWDYFARDCYMLGIKNNFDHNRLMKFMRVIDDNGEKQICFRDKEEPNLYNMFHTRTTLHIRACQHKVKHAIEAMITDALIIANKSTTFRIMGSDSIEGGGKKRKLQECIDDMEAYEKLDDTILQKIMLSTEEDLKDARTIIQRIENRKLYRLIGEIQGVSPLVGIGETRIAIAGKMLEAEGDEQGDEQRTKEEIAESLILLKTTFNYGMHNKDPVSEVRFYSKYSPDECKPPSKDSPFLPRTFEEVVLRIFCKDQDKAKIAEKAFISFCKESGVKYTQHPNQ